MNCATFPFVKVIKNLIQPTSLSNNLKNLMDMYEARQNKEKVSRRIDGNRSCGKGNSHIFQKENEFAYTIQRQIGPNAMIGDYVVGDGTRWKIISKHEDRYLLERISGKTVLWNPREVKFDNENYNLERNPGMHKYNSDDEFDYSSGEDITIYRPTSQKRIATKRNSLYSTQERVRKGIRTLRETGVLDQPPIVANVSGNYFEFCFMPASKDAVVYPLIETESEMFKRAGNAKKYSELGLALDKLVCKYNISIRDMNKIIESLLTMPNAQIPAYFEKDETKKISELVAILLDDCARSKNAYDIIYTEFLNSTECFEKRLCGKQPSYGGASKGGSLYLRQHQFNDNQQYLNQQNPSSAIIVKFNNWEDVRNRSWNIGDRIEVTGTRFIWKRNHIAGDSIYKEDLYIQLRGG